MLQSLRPPQKPGVCEEADAPHLAVCCELRCSIWDYLANYYICTLPFKGFPLRLPNRNILFSLEEQLGHPLGNHLL